MKDEIDVCPMTKEQFNKKPMNLPAEELEVVIDGLRMKIEQTESIVEAKDKELKQSKSVFLNLLEDIEEARNRDRVRLVELKKTQRASINLMEDMQNKTLELKKINKELKEREKDIVRFQSQLIESSKMASLGVMASGLGHELNQPIGAILLKSELMSELVRLKRYDKIQELTGEMIYLIRRVKVIMDAMRIFSREDYVGDPEDCDVNEILSEAIVLIENEFKTLGVSIIKNLSEASLYIHVSKIQISQVIVNIMMNALHAVEDAQKKVVEIKTYLDIDKVVIEISDSGCGISDTIISKIFDPFFTTKSPGQGTGLGLALSYSMLKDNGAEISVSSEENQGSLFKMSFVKAKGRV